MTTTENMNLPLLLGHKLNGEEITVDLTKLPHLLIGGATGSGKSNLIINIVDELAARKLPEEVKFLLIDPKMVEFSNLSSRVADYLYQPVSDSICSKEDAYNDIFESFSAISELCKEMESRFQLLRDNRCRSIDEYNRKNLKKLPYIVLIIDEYADLFFMADDCPSFVYESEEVESEYEDNDNQMTDQGPYPPGNFITNILSLAMKSRAVGIHIIMSTQRLSVDIVHGCIKANMPGRVAFKVSQKQDSLVVLDRAGAEILEDPGDFIFNPGWNEYKLGHAPLCKDLVRN